MGLIIYIPSETVVGAKRVNRDKALACKSLANMSHLSSFLFLLLTVTVIIIHLHATS